MDGSQWKGLLAELGCLNNGRFALPANLKGVTICHCAEGGSDIKLDRRRGADDWSFDDRFLVRRNSDGSVAYWAWEGITAVYTDPL
jgi:hypothetical protein